MKKIHLHLHFRTLKKDHTAEWTNYFFCSKTVRKDKDGSIKVFFLSYTHIYGHKEMSVAYNIDTLNACGNDMNI